MAAQHFRSVAILSNLHQAVMSAVIAFPFAVAGVQSPLAENCLAIQQAGAVADGWMIDPMQQSDPW